MDLVRGRAGNSEAARRRRRFVLLGLAAVLVGSYALSMAIATRLLIGGGGSFTITPPQNYTMLYNGVETGQTDYHMGIAASSDGGETWTADAANPVLAPGAGGTWDDAWVAQGCILWDGTQWVMFYTGFDGSLRRIGRATSSDLTTWTKYASNPVLTFGTGGDFDDSGVSFPTVIYNTNAVHPWQMWYTGFPGGATPLATTIGYAWSNDGISWTKGGRMLDLGAGGAFDDAGLVSGPVVPSGGGYVVHYGGYDGANYHSGYATTTDPETSGAYTKQSVLTGFDSTLTVGGTVWHSNHVRSLISHGGEWHGYMSLFRPGGVSGQEAMGYVVGTDPWTFTLPPAGPLIALGSGWDSLSAENPSVVVTP